MFVASLIDAPLAASTRRRMAASALPPSIDPPCARAESSDTCR